MQPRDSLKIQGVINKEKVVSQLLDRGYIISCEKMANDVYVISIYGAVQKDTN